MGDFTVEKSIRIGKLPDEVYAKVRDFESWPRWSPWLVSEPDCALEFAEDGSSYAWTGVIIGSGRIAVRSESPGRQIDYGLSFFTPWKSEAEVSFRFEGKDGGTEVRWSMKGTLPWFMFWMKPMMTSWIGMDYKRGLLMLKDLLETGSVPSELEFQGEQEFEGFPYLGIQRECEIEEIGPCMESDMRALGDVLTAAEIEPTGVPFSIYYKWQMARGRCGYKIGIPVSAETVVPEGVISGELPSCKTYSIRHRGSYRHLGNAWAAGMARSQAKLFKMRRGMPPFEVYESNPEEVSEEELVTMVRMPMV